MALNGYSEVTVVGTVGDMVTGMMVMGRDSGHIYLPITSADPHTSAILFRGRDAGRARRGRDAADPQARRV